MLGEGIENFLPLCYSWSPKAVHLFLTFFFVLNRNLLWCFFYCAISRVHDDLSRKRENGSTPEVRAWALS